MVEPRQCTVSQDTYIKNTTGYVVGGSSYFNNKYLHLPNLNVWCPLNAGPWQLPPDQIKEQCDQLSTCDAFVVNNDLSGGYLCKFIQGCFESSCDSYVKLPSNEWHIKSATTIVQADSHIL